MTRTRMNRILTAALAAAVLLPGCLSDEPEGIAEAPKAATTVKFDFLHKPLPEIPLPNDIATRRDPTSATGRRINASMVATTKMEGTVRRLIDELDGWGVFMPISIPFSGPLDIDSILAGHRDPDYNLANDVIYLIDIDPASPDFGQPVHLDVGNGNYPATLEDINGYWKNDPRGWTLSILFDEADEDKNGNGVLDPGEDTDADGVLDVPNYLPGMKPARDDLAGRADALMTFYERETHTLIVRPMVPLRERTTYAVVVTRRLHDAQGRSVGSPFPGINHEAQNAALAPLPSVLPEGLRLQDVAFAFTFTTQSVESHFQAVRDGLYGYGVQGHLRDAFPAKLDALLPLKDPEHRKFQNDANLYILRSEDFIEAFRLIGQTFQGRDANSVATKALLEAQRYIDYHVVGSYTSPQLFERTRPCARACTALAECGLCMRDGDGACRTPIDCALDCEENTGRAVATCLLGVDSCEGEALNACTPSADAIGPDMSCLEGDCDLPFNDFLLGYNEQSWPADLDLLPVDARPETVYFWLTVPRKEISTLADGQPAPVVVLGHGYGSNRFTEVVGLGGHFARHGLATIAIDGVSHGLPIDDDIRMQARQLLGAAFGLNNFATAAFQDRGWDHNNDGTIDSAADFWTSYVFHTRDVVRQTALDYLQLIRILRSFDGVRRWDLDVDGDGSNELAGDFDADGQVDIGKGSLLAMTGGSLGGIMSIVVGGIEPEIDVIVPIAGGGGLSDIGNRSKQGGVREAVILRVMGPLYVGTIDGESGEMAIETIVPDLNDDATRPIATRSGIEPGDTMLVVNEANDERDCGYVDAEGRVRVGVASDLGDETRIELYAGDALVTGTDECALRPGATLRTTIDTQEIAYEFQGRQIEAGTPLVALAEGLGEPRATPGLRRFLALGQMVMDPGDPAIYARHVQKEPLAFVSTEKTTGAHALIVTTTGDMNVPASSGLAAARSAGLLSWTEDDPRYGVPPNTLLVQRHVSEAVHTLGRYHDADGNPVHMDVENFGQGTDVFTTPRLNPPLRLGLDRKDRFGGISGAIFPMGDPAGQHGFDFPGEMTDKVRRDCRNACPEGEDCGCDAEQTFDIGFFMFHMLGRYMSSGGSEMTTDLCMSRDDCDWLRPPPPRRKLR
jgi:hypothetical protein